MKTKMMVEKIRIVRVAVHQAIQTQSQIQTQTRIQTRIQTLTPTRTLRILVKTEKVRTAVKAKSHRDEGKFCYTHPLTFHHNAFYLSFS